MYLAKVYVNYRLQLYLPPDTQDRERNQTWDTNRHVNYCCVDPNQTLYLLIVISVAKQHTNTRDQERQLQMPVCDGDRSIGICD